MIEGSISRTISHKEREPMNNEAGLLFLNPKEIDAIFIEQTKKLFQESAKSGRKSQLETYQKMCEQILGYRPTGQEDPFYRVANVSFDRVLIDKHDEVHKKPYDKSVIFMATTLLLSGDFINTVDNENFSYHEINRISGYEGDSRLNCSKKLSETCTLDFQFFDPFIVNKKREWIVQFGFTDFHNPYSENRIVQGTVLLEPEVLHYIDPKYQTLLAKPLQDILNWFNHDITAHATFLPRVPTDEYVLNQSDKNYHDIFFKVNRDAGKNTLNSSFAGELWSLNFHKSLFQEFVKQRPSIMRFLRMHLDKFIRNVELVVHSVHNHELKQDIIEYLIQTYTIGLFRLIDIRDPEVQKVFEPIFSKYPNILNTAPEEQYIRDTIHTIQGMPDYVNKKTISHSEVFTDFVDSIEKTKRIEYLMDSFIDEFTTKNKKLEKSERKFLRDFLRKVSNEKLHDILKYDLQIVWSFKNMQEDEDYNHHYILNIITRSREKIIDLLFNPDVNQKNFFTKLEKITNGFPKKIFRP